MRQFPLYIWLGSQTPAKEVSKPEVSSAVGQQTSAPGDIADVTRYQADNDAEESSDADGWDDAWDDEEKWGDMAVRSLNITFGLAKNQTERNL